jgi:superfamily I DNA and RNA helicase
LVIQSWESLPINPDGTKNFFDALDGTQRKCYDLVVIDEGQDFTEDWALATRLFLRDDRESLCLL